MTESTSESTSMLKSKSLLRLTASAIALCPLAASAHPDLALRPKTFAARPQTPASHTERAPRAHTKSVPARRIK